VTCAQRRSFLPRYKLRGMRSLLLSLGALALACTGAPLDPTEAGPPPDAGRPCELAAQLELQAMNGGTCGAPPIVVLALAADGSVAQASARVPIGVTVPMIPCTSSPPTANGASCTWTLDVVCNGASGQRLTMTGTLDGSGAAWTSDAVTIDLVGSPPGRLACAASGPVAPP